jgi:hypothetical protein
VSQYKQCGDVHGKTDRGYAGSPMLKRQIKTSVSWQEAQNLPGIGKADFSATNTFKVPNEKEAVFGSQDREITTIFGYMCYPEENLSHHLSDFRA